MRRTLTFALLALFAAPLQAAEVEGVDVPDSIQVGDQQLSLNGAGIRKKLWIEVYVGGLYLASSTMSADEAVSMGGAKRIYMHMLYDVSRKKLVGAWEDGFEDNTPAAELDGMSDRLDAFYAMWGDTVEGDEIIIDYVPGTGTSVTFKGEMMGTIEGEDFNQAMLRIWLGDEPADDDLKEAMLGG